MRKKWVHTEEKTEVPVSQAAACEGLVYSVNLGRQNLGTQGYTLPLFED